jgi:head-tail adaptor
MQTSFIDQRRNTNLTDNFYPDTVTIQKYTESINDYGAVVDTWSTLTGHANIPCSIALYVGKETRTESNEYGITTHTIALNGEYPDITRLHRAVSGSDIYEVLYASQSSHDNSVTVLYCNLVSGGN